MLPATGIITVILHLSQSSYRSDARAMRFFEFENVVSLRRGENRISTALAQATRQA